MILNACFPSYARVNIAENFTQPVDYFDFAEDSSKADLEDAIGRLVDRPSLVIFGGGGIYNDESWLTLRQFVEAAPKTVPIVLWGMGINDHGRLDRHYNRTLHYLEQQPNVLIGLRDCFYQTYVPCASCMRPEFDQSPLPQHEVVFYGHHAFPDVILQCPTMSNRVQGHPEDYFNRVIEFLGSADIVLTNTYHGAYWAALLKRKVIVISPFSNKFIGLRYQPVILLNVEAAARSLARREIQALGQLAPSPADAVAESRAANLVFFERVRQLRQSMM